MAEATIFDVLGAGSVVDALLKGPVHWARVGGIFGVLLLATALIAVIFALARAGRRKRLACVLAALVIGAGGTFVGASAAAGVINKLAAPTPQDMETGGTESLEIALLGGAVTALALVASIGKPAPRKESRGT